MKCFIPRFLRKGKEESVSVVTSDGKTITTKMKENPKAVSKIGIALIKFFEGFRSKAYRCAAGIWTVGYGHTATAKKDLIIDETEAEKLLRKDIAWAEKAVIDLVKVDINQFQFDALVSLVFNIGATAFRASTLLKFLNKKNYIKAGGEFPRWVYANGKLLEGLKKRRLAEKLLWSGQVPDQVKGMLD